MANVILTLPCGGEEHRLEIKRDGDIRLRDHNRSTLEAFTAFGAEPPWCLIAANEWEQALGEVAPERTTARQAESLVFFLRHFISDTDIQLIATDWVARLIPAYERIKERGFLGTLPRRIVKETRADLRKLAKARGKQVASVRHRLKKSLAPLRAEALKAERYLSDRAQKVPMHQARQYHQARAAKEIMTAASNLYYLLVPLKGWHITPPKLPETVDQVVTTAMQAQRAAGILHPEDVDGAAHDEQRWQAWYAARVVAARQQGKRWPRVG
jgi:hypothetical protein